MRVTVWADSPRVACFIGLRKVGCMRITGCQYRLWVGLLQSSLQREQPSQESFGLCAVHCSNLYFLLENYPIFCKLYIDEEHLRQIFFFFFRLRILHLFSYFQFLWLWLYLSLLSCWLRIPHIVYSINRKSNIYNSFLTIWRVKDFNIFLVLLTFHFIFVENTDFFCLKEQLDSNNAETLAVGSFLCARDLDYFVLQRHHLTSCRTAATGFWRMNRLTPVSD